MKTKRNMGHQRLTLLKHLMNTTWSESSQDRFLQIITNMPRSTPSEIQEGKAEEILNLIRDCRTEEEALESVRHLME